MDKKIMKVKIIISVIVGCILSANLMMPIQIANAMEDKPDQQIITMDQLNSGTEKTAGAKSSSLLAVTFIFLSTGIFLLASSGHWLCSRKNELLQRKADIINALNMETSQLKNYLDSSEAIRDCNLNVIIDLESQINKMTQLQQEHDQTMHQIDSMVAALKMENAKGIENLMRRYTCEY